MRLPSLKAESAFRISLALILISCCFDATADENKPQQPARQAETAKAENAKTPVVITAPKSEFSNKIITGEWKEKIADPHCVDIVGLIEVTAPYKEIAKRHIDVGTGRYWILMSMASETVRTAISDYAREKRIYFICPRNVLFPILKRLPEFKDKTDDELIKQFDITAQIADYALKKNQGEEEKAKEKSP